MIVFLQLTTAGVDSGPFDLYSNLDAYSEPFEENVSRASLIAGYSTDVPDYATTVRITSKEDCISSVDITLRDVECDLEGYTGEITTTTTTTIIAIPSILICDQNWTIENLDVVTYNDGTPIPQVTDPTEWANLTTGAWCYYNNDSANDTTYGKLYNWYAVAGIHDTDPNTPNKTLAPVGYHIPTDAEWTTVENCLGGFGVSGGKMKSTGTSLWLTPNVGATNSSGFTGLPGGYRLSNGSFAYINYYGYWWNSSEYDDIYAWGNILYYSDATSGRSTSGKPNGFSVRLIKD
jgi:uncharacterized protein (TIGR02145 family)